MTARPHRGVTMLELQLNVEKFTAAFQAAADAAKRAAETLSRLLQRRLPDARTVHGPWNFTGDGQWQSDMCAGWLHAVCPLADRCDCTCHGGVLR